MISVNEVFTVLLKAIDDYIAEEVSHMVKRQIIRSIKIPIDRSIWGTI